MQADHNTYGQVINSAPMNRYPSHFPQYQDVRPRQQFGRNRYTPYYWHGTRPRFVSSPMRMNSNIARLQYSPEGYNNGRGHPFTPHRGSFPRHPYPPQYDLRTYVNEKREECPARRVNAHFMETVEPGYFTTRSGSNDSHPLGSRDNRVQECGGDGNVGTMHHKVQTLVHVSKGMKDKDGNSGGIEYEHAGSFDPEPGSSPLSDSLEEKEDNVLPLDYEVYAPENPAINTASEYLTYKDMTWSGCSALSTSNVPGQTDGCSKDQSQMASCDGEGFHEAFVGASKTCYPLGLGKQIEVAGYGVWFSDRDERNFSGVLKEDRAQNLKAVMIHGSARAIEAMKNSGHSRVRINLATDYLNKNVTGWISKYMKNPSALPFNWDEVKYHAEIMELCNSASGMIIKWSHCNEGSMEKSGIAKATNLAKEATDAWMNDWRLRQAYVGTPQ